MVSERDCAKEWRRGFNSVISFAVSLSALLVLLLLLVGSCSAVVYRICAARVFRSAVKNVCFFLSLGAARQVNDKARMRFHCCWHMWFPRRFEMRNERVSSERSDCP